jgi:hypothetical protein
MLDAVDNAVEKPAVTCGRSWMPHRNRLTPLASRL